MNDGEDLLTLTDVAERLDVSLKTVMRYVLESRFPVARLSRRDLRVRRSDLETWRLTVVHGLPGRDAA